MATVKKNISIPENIISQQGGIVILTLKEYQLLCKRAAPTYYLDEDEAKKTDLMVAEGVKAYKKGKCKKIKSLADLDKP